MKILIPYFEIMGTDSYPDDAFLFSGMQLVEYQGQQYWLTDYTGNKNLQVGATYEQYAAWLATQPPITGIRVISVAAMRNRFTSAERKIIRNHIDFDVLDAYEDFILRQYIDLDDPNLRAVLEYMTAPTEGEPVLANIERVDEMLVDGTKYEKYELKEVGV